MVTTPMVFVLFIVPPIFFRKKIDHDRGGYTMVVIIIGANCLGRAHLTTIVLKFDDDVVSRGLLTTTIVLKGRLTLS